jgi:hypothetical protein
MLKTISPARRHWFGIAAATVNALAFARINMLVLVLAAMPAAAELYKYKNEDGVTVLDSHVPARYVKDGYTILSLDGRVLEVVERALNEGEIRARDLARAADAIRDREGRERQLADQRLLQIYGTPEDVLRARDTKLVSVRGFIAASETNLQRLQLQKQTMAVELADLERRGGQVAAEHIEYMRDLALRIRQSEREINEKRRELIQLGETYAVDLQRVRELLENAPRS